MVVSAHPQGSRIGVQVLQEGGNAIDAAVATGFALAVCYPEAGNIGGGGFMVLRKSDGSSDVIDFREKAPLVASRDMYLSGDGNVVEGLSTETHLAAGVPGSVDGLIRIHSKYGKLRFRKVIQPAIDLARNGYSLTEEQARSLNGNKEYFIQKNKNIPEFVKDSLWKEGDVLKQEDLACTLERIRDFGRDGFYSGKTAELMITEFKRGNGIITQEDLDRYESLFRKPLVTEYKGYRLITVPPPSGGGIILFQLLGIVESYPLSEWGFHSVNAIHLITEAERRVYADRAEYSGDQDFVNVPVEGLLDSEYLKGRLDDFDETRASLSSEISAGSPEGYVGEETTHYSVVDGSGNAVAVTTTLNNIYGSSIIVDGAGFFLNNEMNDFSVKPGVPNIFGLTGGEANAIEPGKRMLSSMTPVIVEKDGKLFLVAGSPGGSTIPTSVFQVIINVIDHNMDIGEAVDTGRFHHQWLPDWISYEENGIDSLTLLKLKQIGHEIKPRQAIGRVNAIQILPDGSMKGGADKRGNNAASGY
ncbi:MAG: gamma-glutamyltransferase [Bacteroidetes bacterium RBG_13_43_22]|nr:MAG: gamma-glutamyltransferase [Bacteroidetes bacterium RBG_13_43_22]